VASDSEIHFGILGPLEARKDERVLGLGGPKQRAALAILLLHANEVVSTDRLIDNLWGDRPPRTATSALRNSIARLRRALEPDLLLTRTPGYLVRLKPDQLDLSCFERLVARDPRLGHSERADQLRQALALWRGPPLAEFAFEPFAQNEIVRLKELRLVALEERIDADLALGRHADLVAELELLIRDYPLRERPRQQLMLALYRSGRQAEALEAYQNARQLLVNELGIEPSDRLQQLERAILTHDSWLELTPQPITAARSAQASTAEARLKTISVLCADLVAAPGVADELSPEKLRQVLSPCFVVIREAVERHGGMLEKFIGDTVMAVFGVPELHEDDALRAIKAAIEIRDELTRLNTDSPSDSDPNVSISIGVNTGKVITGGDDETPLVIGDAVNFARRLEGEANQNEILLGETTWHLVRGAATAESVSIIFDSEAKPVRAWRLLDLRSDSVALPPEPETPLIGRVPELEMLREAFEGVIAQRTPRLFVILGEAGIGKTRLASEIGAALEEDATVLTGRCLAYGERITFWPLLEVARRLRNDDLFRNEIDHLIESTEGALGAGESPGALDQALPAVRQLLERVAAKRPLLLVFDDIHWAQPPFLDLIEYIAGCAHAPIMLLCLARPDFVGLRPDWPREQTSAASLLLEPLSSDESSRLIQAMLPQLDLRIEKQILEASEGNPLFIEQMLAEAEQGPGKEHVPVPLTIQALLAARLERLEPDERAVLEAASIAGKDFWLGGVEEVLPEEARPSAVRNLLALRRKRFVRPTESAFKAEDAFEFGHNLIQEAAYRGIVKQRRADMHERFGDWLEGEAGARPTEYGEILGFHFEQAARYRREFGWNDSRTSELAARAGRYLAVAGERALDRDDIVTAKNLLERAANLLPEQDSARADVFVHLGESLLEAGELGRAGRVLDQGLEAVRQAGLSRADARAVLVRSRLRLATGASATEVLAEVQTTARRLEQAGEEQELALALNLAGICLGFLGRAAAAAEAHERALEVARRVGQERAATESLSYLISNLSHGPTPAAEAIHRLETILSHADDRPRVQSSGLGALSWLYAIRGRFEEARAADARSRALPLEVGSTVGWAVSSARTARIELLAGDAGAAERVAREGYEVLHEMGERAELSAVALALARALYLKGRADEADRFIRAGEAAGARDDIFLQVGWRTTRALVLAELGMLSKAENLAHQAVEIAMPTDFLDFRGDALCDLAEVLFRAGKPEEASAAAESARRLYKQKGNLVMAGKARDLVARSLRQLLS
jgi:DNA-binding SARP family transcriptional activator